MPWATVTPTRTVIIPYASPPIKPIGQTTIEAYKDNTTCNLIFQVIDTDQPALVLNPAKHLECLPSTPTSSENVPLTVQPPQGHQTCKIHHPDIRGEPSQVTWREIHESDRRQRSLPEHPCHITIIPYDHHVYTMGPLQVDKATICHIISVRRVATPNPYGPGRPPSRQHRQ